VLISDVPREISQGLEDDNNGIFPTITDIHEYRTYHYRKISLCDRQGDVETNVSIFAQLHIKNAGPYYYSGPRIIVAILEWRYNTLYISSYFPFCFGFVLF
jgi:hypothetical protein